MNRDELVKAVAKAIYGQMPGWYVQKQGWPDLIDAAVAAVNESEPLIRADEREKIILVVAVETLNQGMADLRAKAEALDWWVDDPDHEDPISTGVVLRDEMLALFKEVSDGATTP